MIIQQGDQYAISFRIKIGNTVATPQTVDDVRVQIKTELKEISDASLVYNSEKQTWDYYLTEEMTRAILTASVDYQVGVKVGSNIRYSPVKRLQVGHSIIKDAWSDG